jgi:hypothetical protein
MKHKTLIILLYIIFGYPLKTKYRNLEIFIMFGLDFWWLKPLESTSFSIFQIRFSVKFRQ